MPTALTNSGGDGGHIDTGSAAGDAAIDSAGDDENNRYEDEDNGLDEYAANEGLNLSRIGENRAHLDDGYCLLDYYDDPDFDPDGQWSPVDPAITNITFNGAKRDQWRYAKSELQQIEASCIRLFGTQNPTKHDVAKYFFGPSSPLFILFRNRLGMNHKEFLDFMSTNNTLAEGQSASQLYDTDFPNDLTGLMEKLEYTAWWRKISVEGVPDSSTTSVTFQKLFWEEVEETINKLLRALFIEGRSGRIINLIDDDKFHHESRPSNNKQFNVKMIKLVRDNRWGMVQDTNCAPSLLFAVNILTHRRKSKQIDNTKMQLFGSAYGDDPARAPNLSFLHMHMDRGYSFEKQHQEVLAPAQMGITCTTARSSNVPFNYGQTPKPGDKRIYLAEGGISSLRMMKKNCHGRLIVCGAFNTGTAVVLYNSTEHRTMQMDFVTTTEHLGELWHNDRQQLRERGFAMEESIATGIAEKKHIHQKYMQLFFQLPIIQVTVCSNHREWHLARRTSFTSKQTYSQIAILRKRFVDLDNEDVRRVMKFMYKKTYSFTGRQAEKERQDQAVEEAANDDGEDPISFESNRSIQELMAAQDDEFTVEEKVRRDLHGFRDLMCYDSGEDFAHDVLNSASGDYLAEFLRQVRCSLPATRTHRILLERCMKYVEEPLLTRDYVLRNKKDLGDIYKRKHGKQATGSWGVKKLIEKITEDVDEEALEDVSFEQDVMNTIVAQMCLPHLSDAAKEACEKGHEMEPVYSKHLMKLSKEKRIPLVIEDISSVGIVEKSGESQTKASVDRILGISEDGDSKLCLCEFKARVKQLQAQKEQDRIHLLRGNDLMGEDDIFVEMNADDPLSYLGIAKPDECLQVLHHAYTYSMSECLHAVGDTRELMSVCKMTCSQELLESYGRVLVLLYNAGLNIFYRDAADDDIDADDTEMKRIEKAVEKQKATFQEGMTRFEFNYRLVRKLLRPANLPLPPCSQILPFALGSWNIMKPSGDMITQMIWSANYHPPINNAQTALVKKLAHQIPMYTFHRLCQMLSRSRPLNDFRSILSYRNHVRKDLPFWKSIKHLTSILRSMSAEYDPERPLPPAAAARNQITTPNGVPVWHDHFPSSGSSPQRYRSNYYGNDDNSHLFAWQRRHRCIGLVHVMCDENGKPLREKKCAQCNKDGATWYCGTCRLFFHNTPRTSRSRETGAGIPVMAASTGKRKADGSEIFTFARFTCSDQWHYPARQQCYTNSTSSGDSITQPIPSHSIVQFDPNVHNSCSNLSFEDAEDTITTGGDD